MHDKSNQLDNNLRQRNNPLVAVKTTSGFYKDFYRLYDFDVSRIKSIIYS